MEGEKMVVVPLSKPANDSATTPGNVESETMNWIGFAAGGTLVTAGLLLLAVSGAPGWWPLPRARPWP